MPVPRPKPKALKSVCSGGHDLVRDSPAVWISANHYVPALYSCIVCNYLWESPDEPPTTPRPSKFHVQDS